jgi:hypothetical protein
MNKRFKKIFYKRSKLLFIIALLETVLSLWFLSYFNYLDRLNYAESSTNNTKELALLLQNMYTSTFWGLLIIVLTLISIFAIISFIYRDEKFQMVSCGLWLVLLILAINIKDTFLNNVSTLCIFIPLIILNFVAFNKQKHLNQT